MLRQISIDYSLYWLQITSKFKFYEEISFRHDGALLLQRSEIDIIINLERNEDSQKTDDDNFLL